MMLNITYYWRNANQNYNEIPSRTSQNGHYQKKKEKKKLQTINAGEGVRGETSYTVGGNVY